MVRGVTKKVHGATKSIESFYLTEVGEMPSLSGKLALASTRHYKAIEYGEH